MDVMQMNDKCNLLIANHEDATTMGTASPPVSFVTKTQCHRSCAFIAIPWVVKNASLLLEKDASNFVTNNFYYL